MRWQNAMYAMSFGTPRSANPTTFILPFMNDALNCRTECSYTFQRKSKYSGPLYIQELEERVRMLESENQNISTALHDVFPNLDIHSHDLAETIRRQVYESRKHDQSSADMQLISRQGEFHSEVSSNPGELLETMIEAAGRLSIDEEGHCQYHGDFAGIAFLQQIDERCSQLLGVTRPKRGPFSKTPLQQAFGSAIPSNQLSADPMIMFNLPPKETAQQLTGMALDNAFSLMTFIHKPIFNNLLTRIYATKPENYCTEELAFLPLLYVTLAIGELFSGSGSEAHPTGSLNHMKGVKWFRAGQALIDTANCRDMLSLQTLVCIIIYLQSSALMHSCYSYISTAISVSLQMGLHRAETSLDPIEQETRRRVFWVLQTMETYVTTLLGLPTVLDDEDIDQDLPQCAEDFLKGSESTRPEVPVTHRPVAPVVAHINLLKIQRRIVKDIYPRTLRRGTGRAYRVNYARVLEFDKELEEWHKQISAPMQSESDQPGIIRTQLLLRLAYAHVQMVLYRPFILHVIRTSPSDPPDMRSFACASSCIKAAMQIVWLIEGLEHRGLLISEYWFTVYITFFAVMALCMFIISNPDDPTFDDALSTAEKGRRILIKLASESVPAEKCVASLGTLFDKISLLCLEHQRSRELARSPPQVTQSMTSPTQLSFANLPTFPAEAQTPYRNLPNDSGVDLPSQPALTFTAPEIPQGPNQDYNSPFADTHMQQGGLLAMAYPPLDGFTAHPQQPPLPSPIYGHFASPTDNEYFPYFNAGWEDGILPYREMEH
ncbi:uncharacterized protein LY89DRAFT_397515 [Mollisia scopiformis]|uniref:Xylanolytic transcriptional activator regulatory domain-containing protein n=1 Tax=Mollisia scopiformis TaxID=149040 RepID=A0A132B4G1_MOLSC|nr:uncharacterized protein LY89DRAFT_397515 [Mollisia scopiformis]KUJ06794.1 hypothetical protein LY89DRAFT_397515 [Mollisia scopiformis]